MARINTFTQKTIVEIDGAIYLIEEHCFNKTFLINLDGKGHLRMVHNRKFLGKKV